MKLSPSFFIKEQHHFRKCTIFLSRLLVFDGLMKNDRNVLIVHETIHNEERLNHKGRASENQFGPCKCVLTFSYLVTHRCAVSTNYKDRTGDKSFVIIMTAVLAISHEQPVTERRFIKRFSRSDPPFKPAWHGGTRRTQVSRSPLSAVFLE